MPVSVLWRVYVKTNRFVFKTTLFSSKMLKNDTSIDNNFYFYNTLTPSPQIKKGKEPLTPIIRQWLKHEEKNARG